MVVSYSAHISRLEILLTLFTNRKPRVRKLHVQLLLESRKNKRESILYYKKEKMRDEQATLKYLPSSGSAFRTVQSHLHRVMLPAGTSFADKTRYHVREWEHHGEIKQK